MRKHSTTLPHSAITILFQLERNRSTNIRGRGSDISLKLTRFCRPSTNSFIIELQIIRSDGESYFFFFTRCQSLSFGTPLTLLQDAEHYIFSSPTYSCTTSFPATLPVFFTGMVTVREFSAVIVLAEAIGLP